MAKEAKPTEDKAEKFIRLGEKRLNNAVHAIQLLKPLSDRERYEYTERQAKFIITTLRKQVAELDSAFKGDNEKNNIKLPRK